MTRFCPATISQSKRVYVLLRFNHISNQYFKYRSNPCQFTGMGLAKAKNGNAGTLNARLKSCWGHLPTQQWNEKENTGDSWSQPGFPLDYPHQ
jgi:hypothetical protein